MAPAPGWRAAVGGLLALAALPAPGAAEPSPEGAPAPSPPAFEACRADLATWAGQHGVPEPVAREQLSALASDPEVLAASQSQGEFVKPIWAYIDAGVTEARVADGMRKLAEWAPTLEAIERRYGVDRHVLVAFWGVESSYGAVLDDPGIVKPVVRSLATLACGDPARAGYWRDELTAALMILAQGDAPLSRLPNGLAGSWAGAMGQTQFMPTVYLAHAVDFDADGRRDIWTSVPDALASTAKYLRDVGWRPGEGWGFEVLLPEDFDPALADETTPRTLAAWRALGLRPARARPAVEGAEATLILPAGLRGPAFLLFPNFRAILRYNTALSYALTVGHLADRLRGEPGFARDWPRDERVLSGDERRTLQARLAERGFSAGGVDGRIGPKTRAAIRAYQGSVGLPADGYAGAALLERINAAP